MQKAWCSQHPKQTPRRDKGVACGSRVWTKGRTQELLLWPQRNRDPPDHHTLAMGPHDHRWTMELGMISVPPYPAPWLYPGPHD